MLQTPYVAPKIAPCLKILVYYAIVEYYHYLECTMGPFLVPPFPLPPGVLATGLFIYMVHLYSSM